LKLIKTILLCFILSLTCNAIELQSIDSLLLKLTPINQDSVIKELQLYSLSERIPFLQTKQILILRTIQKNLAEETIRNSNLDSLIFSLPSENIQSNFLESYILYQKQDTLKKYLQEKYNLITKIAMSENDHLRYIGTELIRYLPQKNVKPILKKLLQDKNPRVTIAAIHSIDYLHIKELYPLIEEKTKSPNPYIRFTANEVQKKLK